MTGITVRDSSYPYVSKLGVAGPFQVETIARIVELFRELHDEPNHTTVTLEFTRPLHQRRVELYGLIILLAQMLQYPDPLGVYYQRPGAEPLQAPDANSALHLFSTIELWVINLPPLLQHERDEQQAWQLFFDAVDAIQRGDSQKREEALRALEPDAPHLAPLVLTQRAYYYAKHIVPEYRRWFTGIDGEFPLPRI